MQLHQDDKDPDKFHNIIIQKWQSWWAIYPTPLKYSQVHTYMYKKETHTHMGVPGKPSCFSEHIFL